MDSKVSVDLSKFKAYILKSEAKDREKYRSFAVKCNTNNLRTQEFNEYYVGLTENQTISNGEVHDITEQVLKGKKTNLIIHNKQYATEFISDQTSKLIGITQQELNYHLISVINRMMSVIAKMEDGTVGTLREFWLALTDNGAFGVNTSLENYLKISNNVLYQNEILNYKIDSAKTAEELKSLKAEDNLKPVEPSEIFPVNLAEKTEKQNQRNKQQRENTENKQNERKN